VSILDFISDNLPAWVIVAGCSYALWQVLYDRRVWETDKGLRRHFGDTLLQGMLFGALLTVMALLIRLVDSM